MLIRDSTPKFSVICTCLRFGEKFQISPKRTKIDPPGGVFWTSGLRPTTPPTVTADSRRIGYALPRPAAFYSPATRLHTLALSSLCGVLLAIFTLKQARNGY